MTPHIGQSVIYYADYRDGIAHPEAATIVAVMGERVNLVHWSAAGVQSARHDVTESREACPGCWSPMPGIEEQVRAEVQRLLDAPAKKGSNK